MPLAGTAFLALWNDFDPARDDEYDTWHTFEHVPERVGIDGVVSGRRYVARERMQRRWFTLYELDSLATLDGASYNDVVAHPTEWTLSMRPSFANFVRRPCATIASLGQGHGAAIATERIVLPQAADADAWRGVLQSFIAEAVLVAAHVGRVDVSARFPLGNAAEGAVEGVPYVLLLEAGRRESLDDAAHAVLAALRGKFGAEAAIDGEAYDLAFTVLKSDLDDASLMRQPPRPALRARWPREA